MTKLEIKDLIINEYGQLTSFSREVMIDRTTIYKWLKKGKMHLSTAQIIADALHIDYKEILNAD